MKNIMSKSWDYNLNGFESTNIQVKKFFLNINNEFIKEIKGLIFKFLKFNFSQLIL